jgi:RNA polymerase sigma-70 factor (ECF subfamily)
MEKSTLNDLIEKSRGNDEKAFRKIVESYQSMIYSLSFRLLCDEEDAKDIVQDTFVKVWMNLSGFETDRTFSTWLYTITTNLCLDKLKSSKCKLQSKAIDDTLNNLLSIENTEQKLINSELAEIILTLTNELTPKQKIVFTLRHLEELEVEEIVQITGMSPGKIKSNLFLARQTIRKKLQKYTLL